MTREEAKAKLGESATEEMVSIFLNEIGSTESAYKKQLAKFSDYDTYKSKVETYEKASMTEQQKLEEEKKIISKNLADSKKILNSAKAKIKLAPLGLDEEKLDQIVNSFISEDEESVMNSANLFYDTFTSMKETAINNTKQELINANAKPTASNVTDDSGMTKDKFNKLSYTEKLEFKRNNPEKYESIIRG